MNPYHAIPEDLGNNLIAVSKHTAHNHIDEQQIASYDRHDRRTDSTHSYDANGNLTSDGINQYRYNAANQLTRVVTPDGTQAITTTYGYDGWGNLVRATVDDSSTITTTDYLLDERSSLPQILGAQQNGTTVARYAYGPDGLVAQQVLNDTTLVSHYPLRDGLGSVRALVDATGATVLERSYAAFGAPQTQTGSAASALGFTGELQDAQTGLVYLRARWYDPAQGRFLQRDRFTGGPTRPQSLNRYAYTENNPVNWTDPRGRCVGWVWRDPTCQFIGRDRILRGDLEWAEAIPWAGAGVDFSPVGGDLKGFIEAFTGRDLVTGEELGAWRWAGLVFLSELRHLRHADNLATRWMVRSDLATTRALARSAPVDAATVEQLIQPRGLTGKAANWWLNRRGLMILYRGQAARIDEILSPWARKHGMAASRNLVRRMHRAGYSDEAIASFTARFHTERVNIAGLGKERWGAAGIPTTRIPGVAAPYAGNTGSIAVIRTQRTLPIRPSDPWYPAEQEWVFFHTIPQDHVLPMTIDPSTIPWLTALDDDFRRLTVTKSGIWE